MQVNTETAFSFDIPYPLAEDDTLFFLHMFKCSGGSFTHILMQSYPPEQALLCHMEDLLLDMTPRKLSTYRYVHGHIGYVLMDYFPVGKRPVWVTFLRNPLERTLSHYFFKQQTFEQQAEKGHINAEMEFIMEHSFEDFARSDWRGANNLQVQALLLRRGERWRRLGWSEEKIVETLKHRLEHEAVFFGLTERFAQSVELFFYTFGWRPYMLQADKRYHATHGKPRSSELSEETKDIIRQKNHMDFAIYDFASELFERRYQAMLADWARVLVMAAPKMRRRTSSSICINTSMNMLR